MSIVLTLNNTFFFEFSFFYLSSSILLFKLNAGFLHVFEKLIFLLLFEEKEKFFHLLMFEKSSI